jgi:hypothetical protein
VTNGQGPVIARRPTADEAICPSTRLANENPGGAVTAGPSAGNENGPFGEGFRGFGVFLALVNARNNDSGSGFAFHDLLLRNNAVNLAYRHPILPRIRNGGGRRQMPTEKQPSFRPPTWKKPRLTGRPQKKHREVDTFRSFYLPVFRQVDRRFFVVRLARRKASQKWTRLAISEKREQK